MTLILSTYLQPGHMKIIPIFVIEWALARLVFQSGYVHYKQKASAQCHINQRAHVFQIPHQPDLQDPWNGCQFCSDNVATLWNCLPSVSPGTISSDGMFGSSCSKTILWCCNCVRIISNQQSEGQLYTPRILNILNINNKYSGLQKNG